MDPLSLRFLRIALHVFAHTLGSVGIFCLYWSCVGAPVAAHALILLGKRNGHRSELRWGNAVRVRSYFYISAGDTTFENEGQIRVAASPRERIERHEECPTGQSCCAFRPWRRPAACSLGGG